MQLQYKKRFLISRGLTPHPSHIGGNPIPLHNPEDKQQTDTQKKKKQTTKEANKETTTTTAMTKVIQLSIVASALANLDCSFL